MSGPSNWLIDASGLFVDLERQNVSARMKSTLPDRLVLEFLVRTSGSILINVRDPCLRVSFDERSVSPVALLSLRSYLGDCPVERVHVTPSGDGDLHQLYMADQFMDRISQLILRDDDRAALVAERAISRPRSKQSSPFATLADMVQRGLGECRTLEDLRRYCEIVFSGRFTITGPSIGDQDYLIYATGAAYRSFDSTWYSVAEGLRLEDGPDYDYGVWVAGTHQSALRDERATFDDIDALIYRPRLGILRTTYSRMLLPVRLGGVRRLVVSASLVDDAIDLRTAGGDKEP